MLMKTFDMFVDNIHRGLTGKSQDRYGGNEYLGACYKSLFAMISACFLCFLLIHVHLKLCCFQSHTDMNETQTFFLYSLLKCLKMLTFHKISYLRTSKNAFLYLYFTESREPLEKKQKYLSINTECLERKKMYEP